MSNAARIRLLCVSCLLGLAVAVPCGVAAAAEPGAVPPAGWSRFNGWRVTGFEVVGLPGQLSAEAIGGLRLAGSWKLLKGRTRPDFQEGLLRDDLRRLRLFLARHGYPASRPTVLFVPESQRHQLQLTVRMDPGPRVHVGALEFSGWPAGVDTPDTTDMQLPTVGRPLIDADVEALVVAVQEWLRDAGYAHAQVKVNLAAAGPALVNLRVDVEPGELFTITEVEITGCSADLVPVARRVMDIAPGTRFGATLLENAAADLRTTQLFGHVELVVEPVVPGALKLTAELTDALMRSWRASAGTWSDNPIVVRAGWDHRNLLGRGRGFDVRGTYATHQMGAGAEVYQLGLLSPRARTSLGTVWIQEDEDAYFSEEYRLELIQSFRPRNRAYMNLGVGLSVNEVEIRSPDEDELPEDQDWMLEVWADRKWDWTDDILYPTRGAYLKVRAVVAPPAPVWGNSYYQVQLDGTAYLPLSGRFLVATRGRFGWSQPLGGGDDVLANRRFYAGGYNSQRGYERRKLGPRDSSNNPRGGQTVFLGGMELRSRLVWELDLAAFVDAGQVWRDYRETNIDGMEVAAGVDLDLRTPLGPLRGGYAWNLTDPPPGEPTELWHFGIGYPW